MEIVTKNEPTDDKEDDSFLNHVDKNLMTHLKEGVVLPNRVHGIGYQWTNNQTESANHILKVRAKWKQNSLPDLINIIENIVRNNERDMWWAIVGQGNFQLVQSMQHHQIIPAQWSSLPIEQKKKRINAFRNCSLKKSTKISTSANGLLKLVTSSGSKKPNQRKRPHAEKNRSKKKMRLSFPATE